jgi:hypothetical protein
MGCEGAEDDKGSKFSDAEKASILKQGVDSFPGSGSVDDREIQSLVAARARRADL